MSGIQTWKECVLECNEDAVNREDAENRNSWRIGIVVNRLIIPPASHWLNSS